MKKFIIVAAITLAAMASSAANAAMVVYAPTNPFTFSADKGILTFSYSGGGPMSQIAAGDDNPAPPISNQSYDAIGDAIETVFGLSANTFSPESAISGSSFKGDISGSSATITSDIAYDYLAVHFGGYEVFFHFAGLVAAGTDFNIFDVSAEKHPGQNGGAGGGLSNYRAYNSGVSEVPVPAALWLFAPALLGLMGFRKRKNKV
jgi:hypothetical protein